MELRKQKRWRAPFYWAAFVLQGEYTQRVEAGNSEAPRFAGMKAPLAFGLTALACLLCGVYLLKQRRGHALRPKVSGKVVRPDR
jgi:hypothetical protein